MGYIEFVQVTNIEQWISNNEYQISIIEYRITNRSDFRSSNIVPQIVGFRFMFRLLPPPLFQVQDDVRRSVVGSVMAAESTIIFKRVIGCNRRPRMLRVLAEELEELDGCVVQKWKIVPVCFVSLSNKGEKELNLQGKKKKMYWENIKRDSIQYDWKLGIAEEGRKAAVFEICDVSLT